MICLLIPSELMNTLDSPDFHQTFTNQTLDNRTNILYKTPSVSLKEPPTYSQEPPYPPNQLKGDSPFPTACSYR